MKNADEVSSSRYRRKYQLIVLSCAALVTTALVASIRNDIAIGKIQTGYALIQNLIKSTSTLNEKVLEARFNLLNNYDPIALEVASGHSTLEQLVLNKDDFQNSILSLSQVYRVKIDLIEEFKSRNSILRNSLRYLPEAVLLTKGQSNGLVKGNTLDDLLRDTLLFETGSRPEIRQDLATRLIRLKSLAAVGNSKNHHALFIAVSHAEMIIAQSASLDRLIKLIVQHPVSEASAQLFLTYFAEYQALKTRQQLSRLLLACCTCMLLCALFLQGGRLNKIARSLLDLNLELERRVQDRTATIQTQQAQLISSSKFSALGEMAGGIAHEINNPLAIIRGKVWRLKKGTQAVPLDQDKIKEDLNKIEITTDRISKIIKGLKLFCRNSESDAMERARIAVIVEDSLELCRERFKNHCVELRVNCAADSVVECRPAQISQVILNLLGNAYDAVENLSEKWVALDVTTDNSQVCVSVTDGGKGIPRDICEKIMQPFFTTKEVGKGTGLGLSISLGIAQGHHGRLTYDANCPNTRFLLELPCHQASPLS